MTIPRIIHSMWIGDESKRPVELMKTWKDKNPSCTYILWNEKLLQYFHFSNQKQIDMMPEINGKCDIMRWEILHIFGGFFVDADTKCLREIPASFFDNSRFTCFESEAISGDLLATGFMACETDDPLMRIAMREIAKIEEFTQPAWVACGPRLWTNIVKEHPELPVKIFPSHYFIPKHAHGPYYAGSDTVYSEHYGGSTFGLYGSLK